MEKKMYVAPELEVLEVMVEQGFAASPSAGQGSGGSWGTTDEDTDW